jgi:hypothetical protein
MYAFVRIGDENMVDNYRQQFSSIASLEHEYYCRIWELVKPGKLETLEGKRRILAQLMLEHDQYQYFWEIPYSFAETELEKAFEEEGVNPDLHLVIEAIIVEQVENTDPPEISKAYDALLAAGINKHEARHVIGRVFIDMLWEGSQMAKKGQQPDEDFYLRRIRYLTKYPKKIIKDQQRKRQKGL